MQDSPGAVVLLALGPGGSSSRALRCPGAVCPWAVQPRPAAPQRVWWIYRAQKVSDLPRLTWVSL